MSINIVHFSPTPLAGAPAKLAAAQRHIGLNAISVILADYPKAGPLANKFIDGALVWQDAERNVLEIISQMIEEADVIHVHNDVPIDKVQWLRQTCRHAVFVYQVHSPMREGPLYGARAEFINLPFRAHLSVAQYQPRHYPTYLPVPNLVLDAPSVKLRQAGEKLRVMFSPSHTRGGRWNRKYSERLEQVVQSLQALGRIDLVWPAQPLPPGQLMALRRSCHLSIDEIVTGAYHQISLEGLCAGNVVLNRADYFSRAMLANCTSTLEMPPFIYADDQIIDEVLLGLALDVERTASLQQMSYDYFREHLAPEKLVRIYRDVYETIA